MDYYFAFRIFKQYYQGNKIAFLFYKNINFIILNIIMIKFTKYSPRGYPEKIILEGSGRMKNKPATKTKLL